MANIKSAKKRIKVIDKKTLRNKMTKSKIKTILKKFDAAVASGDKSAAEEQLKVCTSELSKAAAKGILHKNTASRKISRLAATVNKMA
ncbi:MAG: 30S ribosomal protein S20 [Lachnospiraceae bacterium]|nr:30S ribosomal protein S20 [Lachnospiraceae bacterium]